MVQHRAVDGQVNDYTWSIWVRSRWETSALFTKNCAVEPRGGSPRVTWGCGMTTRSPATAGRCTVCSSRAPWPPCRSPMRAAKARHRVPLTRRASWVLRVRTGSLGPSWAPRPCQQGRAMQDQRNSPPSQLRPWCATSPTPLRGPTAPDACGCRLRSYAACAWCDPPTNLCLCGSRRSMGLTAGTWAGMTAMHCGHLNTAGGSTNARQLFAGIAAPEDPLLLNLQQLMAA